MARQKVASLDADNVIALGGTRVDKKTGKTVNNPTSIEGYYLGARKVQSTTGESTLHFFQTANGNVGVWGKTDLDKKLGTIEKGVMAYVQFTGKKKVPRGSMYTFSVEFDPDLSIPVSGLELASDSGADEVTEDVIDSDDDAVNFSEEAEASSDDEDSAAEAAAAADRAAKVQAMLKGGNKGATNNGAKVAKTGTR